jgi:hypothetical protein
MFPFALLAVLGGLGAWAYYSEKAPAYCNPDKFSVAAWFARFDARGVVVLTLQDFNQGGSNINWFEVQKMFGQGVPVCFIVIREGADPWLYTDPYADSWMVWPDLYAAFCEDRAPKGEPMVYLGGTASQPTFQSGGLY